MSLRQPSWTGFVVLLFVLCSFISPAISAGAWDGSTSIDNGKIYWKRADDMITIRMEVRTSGWIGVGWSPEDGKMMNADMVILSGSSLRVKDYLSIGTTTPLVDTISNIEDVDSGRDDDMTWMVFSRKLETNDDDDKPITAGPMTLIWAYGNSVSLNYHGKSRGAKTVTLIQDQPKAPSFDRGSPKVWDSSFNFPSGKLSWKVAADLITFRLESSAEGWVGIGFSPEDKKMMNADMIIISGQGSHLGVADYWSVDTSKPSLDSYQDVQTISVGRDGQGVWGEFSRKLDTGDDEDKVIGSGPMDVIWAYGHSYDIEYHGPHRGLVTLDLMTTEDETGPREETVPTDWDGSQEFEGGSFSWKSTWDSIIFKVQAETTGWVGIGWSPEDGKMLNADMTIMAGENLVVKDYFSTGTVLPRPDTQQDIDVLSVSDENGVKEMIFSKPLNTKDDQDKEIEIAKYVTVIWAYGETPDIEYHKSNRGAVKVLLIPEANIKNPDDALYTKLEDGAFMRDNKIFERILGKYYPQNTDGYAQVGTFYYKNGGTFIKVDEEYLPATKEGFLIKDNFFWKYGKPYAHAGNMYFEVNPDGFYSYQGYEWKDGVRYHFYEGSYLPVNEDGFGFIDGYYWDGKNKFGFKDGEYLLADPNGFYFYAGYWWREDLRYLMKHGRYYRT
eukprot:TRINITY_DN3494_c0_g1_i1.p1 TRINITY_DN3494_c0_g1~~TRINITY_DN3494_c0_g1_i1.p1  ORF type:complete len:669 (+),score=134.10 TRINITY_DN3494_c0_g1_i1:90-2096(+)